MAIRLASFSKSLNTFKNSFSESKGSSALTTSSKSPVASLKPRETESDSPELFLLIIRIIFSYLFSISKVLSVEPSFKTMYSKSISLQYFKTDSIVSSIYSAPL